MVIIIIMLIKYLMNLPRLIGLGESGEELIPLEEALVLFSCRIPRAVERNCRLCGSRQGVITSVAGSSC